MKRYEIFKGDDGQLYWRLVGKNGEIICTGEGHKRKAGCIKAIASTKDSQDAPIVMVVQEKKKDAKV